MIQYLSNSDKKVYNLIRNRVIHNLDAPTLREINEVTKKASPRSAVLALERLEKAGLIKRSGGKIQLISSSMSSSTSISAIDVPLVGIVAAGTPILAEQNIKTTIPVSTALARPGSKYFLLRISGTSMNLAKVQGGNITDGSIVLVRQQSSADNGEIVVALINDEATVKVFEQKDSMVILRPKSSYAIHKPIVLTENCIIQGVVVATLPKNLY